MSMTTEAKTYNGWTNYETWNVALWIDNDQGSQEHWQEQAQDAYDNAEVQKTRSFTHDEQAVLDLSTTLKDHFEAEWEEIKEAAGKHVHISSSMWADLMGAALSEVNWHEIAEHMIEEVDKAENAEEAEDFGDDREHTPDDR
jgi:hypothetical protein